MAESSTEYLSVYRLRWVGYCLLLFALIDSVLAFIPPNFGDPTWRLQIIGKLVETVAIPILGFALVFEGEFFGRKPVEKLPLAILSWICLGLSVVYLLLIPPGLLGGVHLQTQLGQLSPSAIEQQLTRQATPVLAQLQQLETQLNQSDPEQIKNLGKQLDSLGVAVTTDNPEQLKANMLTRINQLRAQTQQQIKTQTQVKIQEVEAKKSEIRKNAVKWSLGALISSVLFFVLWRSSGWARS
ncbi:YlqD family protein [Kovacikia minuta CCNUW1]|uniref:HpsJ-like protein, cyanoexosortase A-associated n=1 Tax=Kovacikia minuta TaxID=2931930 RepID=UPI001CD035CA|nr:HpsJ family protein [Kovacikia minuta]UBF28758.1 YlqD family protein [Kovacikia minuta CCNUW1]